MMSRTADLLHSELKLLIAGDMHCAMPAPLAFLQKA